MPRMIPGAPSRTIAQSWSSGAGTGCSASAAGLPAVHDLALVAEALGVEDGGLADQEVLTFGEELVVGRDHSGAETAVREVDQPGEGEVARAVVGVGVTTAVGGRVVGVRVAGTVLRLVLVAGHGATVPPRLPSGPSKVFVRSFQFCLTTADRPAESAAARSSAASTRATAGPRSAPWRTAATTCRQGRSDSRTRIATPWCGRS